MAVELPQEFSMLVMNKLAFAVLNSLVTLFLSFPKLCLLWVSLDFVTNFRALSHSLIHFFDVIIYPREIIQLSKIAFIISLLMGDNESLGYR